MSEVTRILNEITDGQQQSADQLLPVVYSELRRMAAVKISRERPGQTLDATGLVHEAFLRLAGNQSFESRKHFFAAAAEAMRRILIDRARARNAEKRGAQALRVDMELDQVPQSGEQLARLEILNEAIGRLEQIEPAKAELVKLRYFVGLTIRETANILGISTATADRHWAYARAWLQNEISAEG